MLRHRAIIDIGWNSGERFGEGVGWGLSSSELGSLAGERADYFAENMGVEDWAGIWAGLGGGEREGVARVCAAMGNDGLEGKWGVAGWG